MNIIYESKRTQNTKIEKVTNKQKTNGLGKRLFISLVIIAAAFLLKAKLPDSFNEISDNFSSSVDFISAFNAIEAGLSGDMELSDAVKEACRYAFLGVDDSEIRVLNIDENVMPHAN